MILYIIRHGQAENQSTTGRDADRSLVDQGHSQAAALADFLKNLGDESPTRVFASPYTRAQETARPIWSALELHPHTELRLAADQSLSQLIDLITDHADAESIGIVGHNPVVSRAADILTGGSCAKPHFSMRTGELVSMHIDPQSPIGSGLLTARFRFDE